MHDCFDQILRPGLQILGSESPWILHRRDRLLSLEWSRQYAAGRPGPLSPLPYGLEITDIRTTKDHLDGDIFSRKLVSYLLRLRVLDLG
jgi:hypothetical protein